MGVIICKERSDSGRLNSDGAENRTLEKKWDVVLRRGAEHTPMDPFAAETRLRELAPFAIQDPQTGIPLYAQDFSWDVQDPFYSICTITYKTLDGSDNLPVGAGLDFAPPSFSVHGETVNVRQSLSTVSGLDTLGADISGDCGGLINVTKEGDVNGVDILRRRMRFTVPRYYPLQIVSSAWIKNLASIVGTVCSHPFMSFEVGEIMLAGIDGGPNYAKQRMELQCQFDTSPNVGDVMIGSITLSDVKGFSYVWSEYATGTSPNGKRAVSYPTTAREEKVYEYASWGILGFGA